MVIDGIKPCEEENEDQIREKVTNVLSHNLGLPREETQFEIDNCNRLGQSRDGKQSTIICFRTQGFREEVYKKENKQK